MTEAMQRGTPLPTQEFMVGRQGTHDDKRCNNVKDRCVDDESKEDEEARSKHRLTSHDAGQALELQSGDEEAEDLTSYDTGETLELQSGDEEAEDGFALWCFLKDLSDIREYLHEAWSKHYNGETSLSTVSEVTHFALIFMEKREATFVERWPRFERYDKILEFFKLKMHITDQGTVVAGHDKAKRPNIDSSDANLELQLLLAVPAYRIAHDFCELLPRNQHVAVRSREMILNRAPGCHPFAEILYNTLPDIEGIAKCSTEDQDDMCLDSFTQGLVELYQTSAIRSHTVVSFQVYMEIFTCLGEKGYKACCVWLRSEGAQMKAAAKRHLDFLKRNTTNTSPEVRRTLLTTIQRRINKFVHADGFGQLRAAHSTAEKFHLLSSMPVLCGHFMYTNRSALNIDGIEQSNSARVLLITALVE